MPAYRVEDRSLLLPYYRRLFVDPLLPKLPESLSPNAITHAGHLFCLAALIVLVMGTQSWRFLACMLLLHAYVWCDNADGGHARRTGQTSIAGEYLDHGLDLLNTTYTSLIGVYVLASEAHTLGLAVVCIGCSIAAITAWEQAMTGIYQLGFFNQVESVGLLSALLLIDAVFGSEIQGHVVALDLDVRSWLVMVTFATVGAGLVGALARVHGARKNILPGLGLLAIYGALLWVQASRLVATPLIHAAVLTCGVAFGVRSLRARARSEDLGMVATYTPVAAAGALALAPALVPRLSIVSPTHLVWAVVVASVASSVADAVALRRAVTSVHE